MNDRLWFVAVDRLDVAPEAARCSQPASTHANAGYAWGPPTTRTATANASLPSVRRNRRLPALPDDPAGQRVAS